MGLYWPGLANCRNRQPHTLCGRALYQLIACSRHGPVLLGLISALWGCLGESVSFHLQTLPSSTHSLQSQCPRRVGSCEPGPVRGIAWARAGIPRSMAGGWHFYHTVLPLSISDPVFSSQEWESCGLFCPCSALRLHTLEYVL